MLPPDQVTNNSNDENGCLSGASAQNPGDVWVVYGALDSLKRATGVSACLTDEVFGYTGRGKTKTGPFALYTGSDTNRNGGYSPPGYVADKGLARCHILSRVNGGSGTNPENLFGCSQNAINAGLMKRYENTVNKCLTSPLKLKVYFTAWLAYSNNDPLSATLYMYAKNSAGDLIEDDFAVVVP